MKKENKMGVLSHPKIIDHYVFTNGHLHAGSGSLQHRG